MYEWIITHTMCDTCIYDNIYYIRIDKLGNSIYNGNDGLYDPG